VDNNKKILIIGNGPSTRELADRGFDSLRPDVDTFGMGIGYRYFRKVSWWPTLYAIGDPKVVFSHREELAKVVEDPNVSTKRFYFSWPITKHPCFELIDHSSTGDFCFRKAVELGYQEIYLIGIEGHYVEEIYESRSLSEDEYHHLGFDQLELAENHRKTLRIITKTPMDNPNYFFHEYQKAGDVYSLPQSNKHRDRWKDAAEFADSPALKVVNLSEISKINSFLKSTLLNVSNSLLGDSSPPTQDLTPDTAIHSSLWFGPFDREENKRIEESGIVRELFQSLKCKPANKRLIMVDVGACKGGAFREFAEQFWVIHAFEPNPLLFKDLLEKFSLPNIMLNKAAVSDVEGEEVPFYTSEESLGIGSLKPFRETHEITARVKTIKLDSYLRDNGINRIDFLKIDAEGFDMMVLKGLDLEQHAAEVILCEFEDRKTKPLGYSMQDMAGHLQSFGYTVYVSEWHPVIRYGARHQWRALKLYPCELEDPNAWGNLLAFKTDPGIWSVTWALKNSMNRFEGKRTKTKITDPQIARDRIRSLEQHLSAVLDSTSWRITAPLRAVTTTARRVFGSLRRLKT
jgi:FkbM family methyltransferase